MGFHKATSLGSSLKHKISDLSWERGCVNFFNESVPFSFTNGQEYASLCADIISVWAKQNQVSPSILEFGSGLGVFSQHCIAELKKRGCKTHFTLSDRPPATVEQLTKQFQKDNVDVKCVDITRSFKDINPHVMLCNYVFDTLPVKCLEFKGGVLYEWKLSSFIKEGSEIKDTTVLPFETWGKDAIEKQLLSSFPLEKLPLLSRIHPCIKHTWSKHVCQPQDIDPTGFLGRFLASHSDQDILFNFSPLIFESLHNMVKSSAENKLLIMHDLAQISLAQFQKKEHCYSEFGSCVCYSVPFFLIQFFCEENNLYFTHSKHPDSENQIALLSSLPLDNDDIQNILSGSEPGKAIGDAAIAVKDASSYEELIALLDTHKSFFNEKQLSDYVYCFNAAQSLMNVENFEEALLYIEKISSVYKEMGANASIIESKCYRKLGMQDKALDVLNQTLKDIQNYDLLWLEKAFAESEKNNIRSCINSIKKYFKYVTYNPQFNLESLIKEI
ncbi:hypothetical protein DID78_06905 [Candidatus Marinamargulisbacteria bacterium SCGC AG-343-D04]|nr:hypothetical protein DID78_06905 [Candidatus Marinamargulisbacteria bacterium SCGC AG-343-D04]